MEGATLLEAVCIRRLSRPRVRHGRERLTNVHIPDVFFFPHVVKLSRRVKASFFGHVTSSILLTHLNSSQNDIW